MCLEAYEKTYSRQEIETNHIANLAVEWLQDQATSLLVLQVAIASLPELDPRDLTTINCYALSRCSYFSSGLNLQLDLADPF